MAVLSGARWDHVRIGWVSVAERDVLVPLYGARGTVWIVIGTALLTPSGSAWEWTALTTGTGPHPTGTATSLAEVEHRVVAAWREADQVQAARERLAEAIAEPLPARAGTRPGVVGA